MIDLWPADPYFDSAISAAADVIMNVGVGWVTNIKPTPGTTADTSFVLDIDQALTTMAQIGVALPGFAGVITSLRHRDRTDLTPPERRGLLLMISLAAIVVVGGVAPFVLHAAVGPRQVWRVCGVGLGLALACVAGYNAWIAHRAKGTVAAPRQPRLLTWGFVVPAMVTAATQLLAVAWPGEALYLAGLLLVLVGAGRQFLLLLLSPDGQLRPEA